jgi:hypothetical protein
MAIGASGRAETVTVEQGSRAMRTEPSDAVASLARESSSSSPVTFASRSGTNARTVALTADPDDS